LREKKRENVRGLLTMARRDPRGKVFAKEMWDGDWSGGPRMKPIGSKLN
jgi:hypothetical protein